MSISFELSLNLYSRRYLTWQKGGGPTTEVWGTMVAGVTCAQAIVSPCSIATKSNVPIIMTSSNSKKRRREI